MTSNSSPLTRRQFLRVLSGSLCAGALGSVGLIRERLRSSFSAVRQSRPLLGTVVTITVHHPDLSQAESAIGSAFAAIEHVDRVMSLHRRDSDLNGINQAAGRAAVPVDPMLLDILGVARTVHGWSGGAYDVTCLPIMQLYGFYTQQQSGRVASRHYPSDAAVQRALDAVGLQHLNIDGSRREVGLAREGAGIDLGSIGKGYAVDRAVTALRAAGVEHGLVDAGGNVYALGVPQDAASEAADGWRVAIRNPFGTEAASCFERLSLRDAGVATSGNYEQSVVLDGRRIGHLFDATRAAPVDAYLSTTVVAATATMADALSTTTYLLGEAPSQRVKPPAQAIYFHRYAT
ncbi:MAG: FAD:protein FMN transferase [Deltaproteobacteria bacterium]|nr:FAD:protein FMN transferase [Deltaproteobacteria bacterium]